jgi:segregation and condensation protein A
MAYAVKLKQFEGPLELLLDLIEREKLSITELSLAHVADQYLEFLKNNREIQLDNLADFLSVASKLILIKSRALLPLLEFTDEEEQEITDLTRQLEEYQKFKIASQKLGKLADLGRLCYSREGYIGVQPVFYPPENINVFDLKKYFQLVLNEIPIIEKLEKEIVNEVITLEEKINDMKKMIAEKIEISFAEIAAKAKEKVEVIISFLALLEMVKQRIIEVDQRELFQDIRLKNKITQTQNGNR